MSPSVVFGTYSYVEEALVVCSALNDAGFDASIDNLNHAVTDWALVTALGGIRVRLPSTQLDEARAALVDMRSSAAQAAEPEPIRMRSRWPVWTFGLLLIGPLIGLAPVLSFLIERSHKNRTESKTLA